MHENVTQNALRGKIKEYGKSILRTSALCYSAYYLAKKKRPYTDYPDLITLQQINGLKEFKSYVHDRAAAEFIDTIASISAAAEFIDTIASISKDKLITIIDKVNYFSLLTDGSLDSAVIEKELVYLSYLSENGKAVVKFFSIESPAHTTVTELLDAIEINKKTVWF